MVFAMHLFVGMSKILWMDGILHHLRNHEKPLFVGIYNGIIIPGFLRWCRILSIHSMDTFKSPVGPDSAGDRAIVLVLQPWWQTK